MKTTGFQKILSVVLVLLLVTAVTPPAALAADRSGVTYMKRTWDPVSETVISTETTLTEPLRSFPGQLEGGGWYYIDHDQTCGSRVTIPAGATVNLILADGVTLTCSNGIYVAATATLNIYGQSEDSGLLKATGSSGSAGIGGGCDRGVSSVTIWGGSVDAEGGLYAAGTKEICVYCAGGCGEIAERYTETIPAAGEPDTPPTEPSEPGTPSGDGLCEWCGERHTGFWGFFVGFFHSILYFFAHLFGRR